MGVDFPGPILRCPKEGEPYRLTRRVSPALGVVYTLRGPGWVLEVSREGVTLKGTVHASTLDRIGGVLEATEFEVGELYVPRPETEVRHRCPEPGLALVVSRLRLVGLRVDAYRNAYPSEGGEGFVRMDNPEQYLRTQ